ncbi:MAG: hypothetical protein BWY75_03275 [bacterium ADurb.Bin425]|nr:MAG: hypothetical protein BWY75_03275 [bacterium ADurb.Bin425]
MAVFIKKTNHCIGHQNIAEINHECIAAKLKKAAWSKLLALISRLIQNGFCLQFKTHPNYRQCPASVA